MPLRLSPPPAQRTLTIPSPTDLFVDKNKPRPELTLPDPGYWNQRDWLTGRPKTRATSEKKLNKSIQDHKIRVYEQERILGRRMTQGEYEAFAEAEAVEQDHVDSLYKQDKKEKEIFQSRERVRDLYYFQRAEPTSSEVEGSQGQGRMVPYTRLTQAEREKLEQHYDALDQADGAPSWRDAGLLKRWWDDIPVPHTEHVTKTADEWKPAPLKMETPPAAEPDTKINNDILTDQANKHQQIEPLEESAEEIALRRELETNRDAADQVQKRLLNWEISTDQYDLARPSYSHRNEAIRNQLIKLAEQRGDHKAIAEYKLIPDIGTCPGNCIRQGLPPGSLGHCDPTKQERSAEETALLREYEADLASYAADLQRFEGTTDQVAAFRSTYGDRIDSRRNQLIALATQRGDKEAIDRYVNLTNPAKACPGGCCEQGLPAGSLGHCDPDKDPQPPGERHSQSTEETRQERARDHRERIFSHYGRRQEATQSATREVPLVAERERLDDIANMPIGPELERDKQQQKTSQETQQEAELESTAKKLHDIEWGAKDDYTYEQVRDLVMRQRARINDLVNLATQRGDLQAAASYQQRGSESLKCPGECIDKAWYKGSFGHCDPIEKDENEPEDDTQTQPSRETYKAVYYDTGEYAIGSTKREALEKLHDMDDRGNGDFTVDDLENGDQGQGDTLPDATDDLLGAGNSNGPQENNKQSLERIGQVEHSMWGCPGECFHHGVPQGSHGHCSGNRINYGNTLGGGMSL